MIRQAKLTPPSATALLKWYDAHARAMPWRAMRGKLPNPYHELLSEFMLQQTQIATVIPYFRKFIARWPTISALAKADLEDVRAAWAGLGYYRRARLLHDCAKAIVAQHKGVIPNDEKILLALPGIGPYTAAAIAAIAFDQKAVVVDGNVERVIARVFKIEQSLPKAKKIIHAYAAKLLPKARFGDYAQSVMELGAIICTPKNPQCAKCPWQKNCQANALGVMENYPRKIAKQKIPQKYTCVFMMINPAGKVLMRRRPEKGLFAGMWEFPSTPWQENPISGRAAARYAPAKLNWQQVEAPVSHVFSHFKLEAALRIGHSHAAFSRQDSEYRWLKWKDLSTIATPTLMHKIAEIAQRHLKMKKS